MSTSCNQRGSEDVPRVLTRPTALRPPEAQAVPSHREPPNQTAVPEPTFPASRTTALASTKSPTHRCSSAVGARAKLHRNRAPGGQKWQQFRVKRSYRWPCHSRINTWPEHTSMHTQRLQAMQFLRSGAAVASLAWRTRAHSQRGLLPLPWPLSGAPRRQVEHAMQDWSTKRISMPRTVKPCSRDLQGLGQTDTS